MKPLLEVAVDTGGTFTDFVILKAGRLHLHKVPSRPDNPSLAVRQGLDDLELDPAIVTLIHGTTVATNALLERKGARLCLITDAGFEDVLRIGRQNRSDLYDLQVSRPEPLVRPEDIFGLTPETLNLLFREEDPPYLHHRLLAPLQTRQPEIVCVCLLGAYEDAGVESRLKVWLERHGFRAITSSEVLPEFREFERFSTTVLNAYVAPIMERYIEQLDTRLGLANLQIMQSNGGTLSARTIGREAIHTLLSGPAGGVVGARALAYHLGYDQLITFDMGGTSTDVSLLPGKILYTTDSSFHGWPARIPMIDIHTVGAGGGSLAWMDLGGLLKVGPQSAGADPGPACYGRGREITVTDANVHLGRIQPDFFLGGRMPLFPENTGPGLDQLAAACGQTPREVAEGIVTIANQHMLRALRVISIQRGFNPADFILATFGGAGGLHAAALARELGIRRVLITPCAGVLSALGLLLAEVIKNFQLPAFLEYPAATDAISPSDVASILEQLGETARRDMAREGYTPNELVLNPTVDVRYVGQSWEINIPYQPDSLGSDLRRRHRELYGYVPAGRGWEIINVRLQAVGQRPHPDLDQLRPPAYRPAPRPLTRRPVTWQNHPADTPFFRWTDLTADHPVGGPAVILDDYSTVWVPPDFSVALNAIGGLELCPLS
ncbi:MAG: hydantoinase/oxoprolinase family protein [Acidobacteria bacterium]|nr:hydantoinase/oxoprolinase family protein [Acidobacteriota bacterium]